MTALRPEHRDPRALHRLVEGLDLTGDVHADVVVSDITHDSRAAGPATLYAALPGTRAHGATFAAEALSRGAAAILTDPEGAPTARNSGAPVLVSRALRHDMGELAARVFGRPAEQMQMLGVTGTNGKTTTVALLESALRRVDVGVGTIGTIGFRLDGEPIPATRTTVTTPESPDLQALLGLMRERGAAAVALEVSSHAMALERVAGMRFDVAAFLNLGRDHLDFHPDLEHYFESKAALFTPERTRRAVCWTDDPHGAEIARRARAAGLDVVSVGTREADYVVQGFTPQPPFGGSARVRRDGAELELSLSMPGFHNMVDAVVALAMLESLGHHSDGVLAGLAEAQVPGRMQRVELGEGAPHAVVDFAHTPQAVSATLEALRQAFGRVITVIGCGGDRDPEKRPQMGAAAARYSELVIVTDDNPRTEEPALIRAAAVDGALAEPGRLGEVRDVTGRRSAIEMALAAADGGSVVAVLGKGHEQGQLIGTTLHDFDDVVETARAWQRLTGGVEE